MNSDINHRETIDPLLGSELGVYVQREDWIRIFESPSLEELVGEGCFLDKDAKPAKFFIHPGSLGFVFRSYILLSHGYIFEGILQTPVGNISDTRIYVPMDKIVF